MSNGTGIRRLVAAAGVVGVLWGIAQYVLQGPYSMRSRFRHAAMVELARVGGARRVLTDADLVGLPEPVARYVRRTGSVGRPIVTSFRARIHGRIRAGVDRPWMPFVGEQVNTYGDEPNRLFFITAAMKGLPTDIFHEFVDESANMTVKVFSLVTIVDARGPDMNRSETVTILNDMCVLAPATLIDPALTWKALDDRHVVVILDRFDETVSATLTFDDDDRLVDFVSDDRSRSSSDGRSFTPQRWSTPLSAQRDFDGRRVMAHGEARWHAPLPEGEFPYLDFDLDAITYNVG
ncbi:MAG TPA: DUF6544 family protein [Ilumatobacteraceae bacterium]|nr:DUF6544 family protein [Ilumatobacteraceae bacterium]